MLPKNKMLCSISSYADWFDSHSYGLWGLTGFDYWHDSYHLLPVSLQTGSRRAEDNDWQVKASAWSKTVYNVESRWDISLARFRSRPALSVFLPII